ncbi:MAG: alpha/beta hydrolase [Ruminococcaceae bacterium]|nr:alpha/beta hydrolase [Oscillospiraceae bacterium]
MAFDVTLWEGEIPCFCAEADTPNRMTAYLIDTDHPVPAVVVLPGGGYSHRANHEGEPIAQFYNGCGFQAFVVHYRVAPNRYPAPQADAKRAIRLVRANAKAWGVDPDRVFVCGFSAGGHLAASTAVLPDDPAVADDLSAISSKPTGAVLCYPVISSGDKGHQGSFQNLLGDRYPAEKALFSLEKQVDENTAPCFLWHTAEDQSVPFENSLMMAEALHANGVQTELHVFPHGGHGLGLAVDSVGDVGRWAPLSAAWIKTF